MRLLPDLKLSGKRLEFKHADGDLIVTESTIALDTNVLVYAISLDEPTKSAAVHRLLAQLPPDRTVLLWQVACELNAVLIRLIERGRAPKESLELAAVIRSRFRLAIPGVHVLDEAVRLHRDHRVSYWDSMLIAACKDAGVTRLYTEDRQSADWFGDLEVSSPFGGD